MTSDRLRRQASEYYERKLRAHGPTPAGVDWSSLASQELRFAQFTALWRDDVDATIVDYGCGYGALASYLRARGHQGRYVGFDASPAMTETARRKTASLPGCTFTSQRSEVEPAHYAVASGVFNVRQDTPLDAWTQFVEETVADLASLGSRGFGFNALTSYSDAPLQRPDLYYADPLSWFDHCKRTYSRFVSLLHDYPLWEFTILVRREPA